ncbi:cysteine--tRNA ligase, partial [Candidatus Nomurabacteria bacterium]|nr:cysteine--tRNA ligase [Candidatus Nomurabacteria bacterium]
KEGEPAWESPWGLGRPGWHIECSAMSKKYAGCDTLDIHAGGRDLIFPHHENEIAQSEALTGHPFAKYWIHHGLLTINGQKMAKSLGNFITIEEALKKYTSDDLKLFFLTSHYASSIDYTEEKMAEAKHNREKLMNFFIRLEDVLEKNGNVSSSGSIEFIDTAKKDFLSAMDDDFNTPKALAVIFNFITDANKFMDASLDVIKDHGDVLAAVRNELDNMLTIVLGLDVVTGTQLKRRLLSEEEKDLLNARIEARQRKDFQESDRLRDLLRLKGIVVEDGKGGQTWRRM